MTRRQRGFTLIEVLIAFIVLVVGLLGVLAMQNRSLQHNHLAFLDSQAQLLVTDIVERIRANPLQAASYQIGFDDAVPSPSKDCASAVCSASEIRSWDLKQWLDKVQSQTYLPAAKASITYTASSREVQISIQYSLASVEEATDTSPLRTLTVETRVY